MSARTPGAVDPLGLPAEVPPTMAASDGDGSVAATTAALEPTDSEDAEAAPHAPLGVDG